MSALALALLLEKSTGMESLTHYACGDRNLLGMQADLQKMVAPQVATRNKRL